MERTVDGKLRPDQQVVITGLGVITSIGIGVPGFLAGLRAGSHGGKPITAFGTTRFAHSNGCEIADLDADEWNDNVDPAELGGASQFSVAAAKMAVADAAMTLDELRRLRALVSVGTTDGESRD